MVMKTEMCSRCVLLSTTPGIAFDENQVCNYCRDYEPKASKGQEALSRILDLFRGNGEFDCMVGVSGGRDSMYTLYKLVVDYGLNVLAVHYANPFTSDQAIKNIETAQRLLDVECVIWQFPGNTHRDATARALKAWAYRPSSTMIPIVCTHCKAIWPEMYAIARQHQIRLVMIGSNPLETASFKKAGLGGAREYHKFSKLPRLIAKVSRELLRNPRYLIRCSWGMVGKAYLTASHTSPYLQRRYKDLTTLRLFDYIPWNEKRVLTTIRTRLGWQRSPEVASSWRFDCRLDYVRRQMYEVTTGVTELRDLFSKMIREGQMERQQALERLEKEDFVPHDVLVDVLSDFDLHPSDLGLGSGPNRPIS